MKWKAFAALAIAAAWPQAGWTRPNPEPLPVPTAADFGAVPFFNAPVLSPDGLHYAARAVVGGKKRMIIADPDDGAKTRQFALTDDQEIQWYRWAGNDWLLVSLSSTATLFEEEVRITRLIAIDVHTGAGHPIGLKSMGLWGDDVPFVDPDGKYLLLNVQRDVTEYPTVFRIDIATNTSERVVKPHENVFEWFADSKGVVRVGLAVEGKHWWVYYRADGTGDFARTTTRTFTDADADIDKFLPVPGSDSGYAVALGKNGRFGLYRYDFKTDEVGDLAWENPNYDLDDFDLSPSGELRSVEFTDDRARIEWFDPAMKKVQQGLDKAVPDATNRIVSRSRDDQRMIVVTESDSRPPTYLFFDQKTRHLDLLVEPYDKIAGKRLASTRSVTYAARDGLTVPAYLTLPLDKDPKNLPLVVMPHGGPFVRDSWGYEAWVQFLAARGYAVLQPNYRGSTGYGRDYVEKGTGQFGRGMQDDLDDGVKWLAGQGEIDPQRVCIMGASYGGYAAMLGAVRNPEIYRCAISFAGLSDVGAQLRYDRASFGAPRYFRDWRDRVRGDKNFDLDAISPLKLAAGLKTPLLIAHGDKDQTVPPWQSRRMHETLLKLGRDHEYVVYPGEGHGFDDPAHATDFLDRVAKFLAKYNPS